MEGRKRRAISAGVCVLALVLATGIAYADHAPPRVDLIVGGREQAGRLYWSDWMTGNGIGCIGQSDDGTGQFPAALDVPVGQRRVRIRFFKPQRPYDVAIRYWREADSQRFPVGTPVQVENFDLRAQRNDEGSTTSWRAVFDLNVVGHRYLSMSAFWRDTDGCGGSQGLAERYHLRGLSG